MALPIGWITHYVDTDFPGPFLDLTAQELVAAVDQYLHRAQAVVSVQHMAGLFGVGVMTTCTDQHAHEQILVLHAGDRAAACV